MLIEYIPTFNYFSSLGCTWGGDILDFGSNCGNVLKSNPGVIQHSSYTGVDVDMEAIIAGKEVFPTATWQWYNRYNPVYNPFGTHELPVLHKQYNTIVSYSVFTHTTLADMVEIIDHLYANLADNGTLMFSYCNIDSRRTIDWLKMRPNPVTLVPGDIVYLVNNKITTTVPKHVGTFVSFYRESVILKEFEKYNAVSIPAPKGWYQDCIIIKK